MLHNRTGGLVNVQLPDMYSVLRLFPTAVGDKTKALQAQREQQGLSKTGCVYSIVQWYLGKGFRTASLGVCQTSCTSAVHG